MGQILDGLGQVLGREYSFLAYLLLLMGVQTWALDQSSNVDHRNIETVDDMAYPLNGAGSPTPASI